MPRTPSRTSPQGMARPRARAVPHPAQDHARQFLLASVLLLLAVLLTGCNTAEGIGEDVQAGGRAIERTAE